MSKIALISGYYGFSNPGDDAILIEILKILEENNIVPAVLYNTKKYFERERVHYIPRKNLFYLFIWMKRASFLISGGGGLFQDSTSFKSFLYYFFIIFIARFFHVKVIIYGQSFGPIKRKISFVLLQRVLHISNAIFVRDSSSLKLSYLLCINKKVYILPDIVYIKKIKLKSFCDPVSSGKKIFKILIFPREKGDIKAFIDSLKEISHIFIVKLIIIPMHYDLDREVAEKIYTHLSERNNVEFINKRFSETDVLEKIQDVNCVVSYRFHGLLFSHLLKKPFLGISDDPKLISFLLDLNKEVISSNGDFEMLKQWIFRLYTTRKKDLLLRDSVILKKKLVNKMNKEFIRSIV